MLIKLTLSKEEVCDFLDFIDQAGECLLEEYFDSGVFLPGVQDELVVAEKVKNQIIGINTDE